MDLQVEGRLGYKGNPVSKQTNKPTDKKGQFRWAYL